jgi:hypothetical protein
MTARLPDDPAGVDVTVASPARIYDYYLGGHDNYPADQAAAENALTAVPQGRTIARANRRFLARAVRYMADQGIGQFIDLGTGIPTRPNVHEVARSVIPGARVVYVDNDPLVTAHNRALLARAEGIAAVHGDIREPHGILTSPELGQLIDFDQPVGVLFVAVLHFIPPEDDSESLVRSFAMCMTGGSYLAVSHISSDGTSPDVAAAVQRAYRTASAPAVFRTADQIRGFFDGMDLVPPGLTDVLSWPSRTPVGVSPPALWVLAGVGRKPSRAAR